MRSLFLVTFAVLGTVDPAAAAPATWPAAVAIAGASTSERTRQRKAPRVQQARAQTEANSRKLFAEHGVRYPADVVYLRGFKHEGQLELWIGNKEGTLVRLRTYEVCAPSGGPGPKRRQGDLQVPEGAYRVDRFNPWSAFHLSIGIDYPNASDRILGRRGNLGGDIFIHGDCVTLGCLPIQDEHIKELYVIALDSYLAGRPIAVHIFPRRLDDEGMEALRATVDEDSGLLPFWESLRPLYDAFEKERRVPMVSVDPKTGAYRGSGRRRPGGSARP